MVTRSPTPSVSELYETDETAWLETMAGFVRERRLNELDYVHLAEYLEDMARRDKREVLSRLALLLAHLLKWKHQPEKRSSSWRVTIETQLQELMELLESGVLRNYAEEILAKAYANGIRLAIADTGLPAGSFPAICPYSIESLLDLELPS